MYGYAPGGTAGLRTGQDLVVHRPPRRRDLLLRWRVPACCFIYSNAPSTWDRCTRNV